MYSSKGSQRPNTPKQSGVALVIGLVLLFVVTLIALAGLNNASIQTQTAAGLQQHNLTFQAAEGAISKTINSIHGLDNPNGIVDVSMLTDAINNGDSTTRIAELSDNSPLEVTVKVDFDSEVRVKPGNSFNADENVTTIPTYIFTFAGEAKIDDSGAKTTVEQGIMYD